MPIAFIHLGAMDRDAFSDDTMEEQILFLARPVSNDLVTFKAVLASIENLRGSFGADGQVEDRDEMLKIPLAAAIINKPAIHAWTLEQIVLDMQLRKGLETILAVVYRESIAAAEQQLAPERRDREIAEDQRDEAERTAVNSLMTSIECLAKLTDSPDRWLEEMQNSDPSEWQDILQRLAVDLRSRGPSLG